MASKEEKRIKRLLRTLHALATRVPAIKLRRIEEKFPLLQICTRLKLEGKKYENDPYIAKAGILEISNKKYFICPICHAQLHSLNYLIIHNRVHTGEKPYECKNCKKRFNQSGNYNKHIRICKQKGTDTINNTYTGNVEPTKTESGTQIKISEQKLKRRKQTFSVNKNTWCVKCNRHFINRCNLMRHRQSQSCSKNSKKPEQHSEYRCKYCNKLCLRLGALTNHVRFCRKNVPTKFQMKDVSDDAIQLQNKNMALGTENTDLSINQVLDTTPDKEGKHLMETGSNKYQNLKIILDSNKVMQPVIKTMEFTDSTKSPVTGVVTQHTTMHCKNSTEPQILNVTSDSGGVIQQLEALEHTSTNAEKVTFNSSEIFQQAETMKCSDSTIPQMLKVTSYNEVKQSETLEHKSNTNPEKISSDSSEITHEAETMECSDSTTPQMLKVTSDTEVKQCETLEHVSNTNLEKVTSDSEMMQHAEIKSATDSTRPQMLKVTSVSEVKQSEHASNTNPEKASSDSEIMQQVETKSSTDSNSPQLLKVTSVSGEKQPGTFKLSSGKNSDIPESQRMKGICNGDKVEEPLHTLENMATGLTLGQKIHQLIEEVFSEGADLKFSESQNRCKYIM